LQADWVLFRRSAGLGRGRLLSFLAIRTDPKDSMAVMKRLEPVATNDLVLQLLDLFVVKLDQCATTGADQVVVMGVFVVMLIKHAPVMEFEFPSQTAFFQQLQGAIHRREPDRRVLGLDNRVTVFA